MIRRREFLRRSAATVAAVAAIKSPPGSSPQPKPHTSPQTTPGDKPPLFGISLAQYSLHRTLFAGELQTIDFPGFARRRFDIEAVEYVNTFFKDKAQDRAYLDALSRRGADNGVKSLLIMVDGEGDLGDPDSGRRMEAIGRHRKWLEAARRLGCHSIRVNARSQGTPEEQRDRAADGLRRLTELAAERELNVLVENHGGLSSNGSWLAALIKQVDHPRCGTLPDFENFQIGPDEWYDRYRGVKEMMPFAMAVSAKSRDFDADGNEIHTDFHRMMRIVLDAGYHGYVGIEYEGERLGEIEGIAATKKLLQRIREEFKEQVME